MFNVLRETRKHKRFGRDCAEFERNWAPLLMRMIYELKARSFRIDHNYAFLVSRPKWREIFATSFEGRVADHLLCDILKPYVEKELHPRTFNNREGKGAQSAINQVIDDISEVSCAHTQPCRIIKWDLKGFFPNARRDITARKFDKVIDKYKYDIIESYGSGFVHFLKWLVMICVEGAPSCHCERRTPKELWYHISKEKSLFHKPPGIGVPIGRLTSQMGMGLYLNDEVEWLNEDCGIRSTLFMDDCVMVVPERLHNYSLSLFPELRRRLAVKGISLNEKKFYDQPYQRGVKFLGVRIKPYRIIVNDKTFDSLMKHIDEFNNLSYGKKYASIDRFISTVNSYSGLLKGKTSYSRLQALKNRICPEWWQWLGWDYERLCVVSKPQHNFRARLKKKYHLKMRK